MDPTVPAIIFGVSALIAGSVVGLDLYRRQKELKAAAKKMGFAIIDTGASSDSYIKPKIARGEFRGVRARIGYLAASAHEPSQERRGGALFHLVCGVEIPENAGYLMTRQRPLHGEMQALRSLGFRDASYPELDAHFLFMERSIEEAEWLRNPEVAEILGELAQTYEVVRVYLGWLWVANDVSDVDHLDVDFENLVEARRKLVALA